MGRLIDTHDFWVRLPINLANITLTDVTEALRSTPTVDIVRCKECVFHVDEWQACPMEHVTEDDDFCSRGKRK